MEVKICTLVVFLFITLAYCSDVNRTELVSPKLSPALKKCARPCRPGFRCEFKQRSLRLPTKSGKTYFVQGLRQICVRDTTPAPVTLTPPSCQDLRCGDLQTCVYRQVACFTTPCHPQPVCVQNRCASVRCGAGTTCVAQEIPGSNPICANFPACRYQFVCVPLVRPKPGFCPPPEQVSQANVNLCEYDNSCPADLLCCPGASRGGLNCTAPAYPDPCQNKKCPLYAPTCTQVGCLDRVCEPGTFWCQDGLQCYCSRRGQQVCTDVPAPIGGC